MIKILITGGAGNVGSSLAAKMVLNPGYQVIIMDNLSTGSMENLPSPLHNNFEFIKADVNNMSDVSAITSSYKFDYIFHYAAMVGVKRTLRNPIGVLNDIEGIKNMLSAAKNTGVKKFFYSSSSEVYGEPIEIPQNEHTTPLNSKLPYAIVKNVGEAFLRSYHQVYGLNYTIFRFFNTYGPNQSRDFVVSKFMQAALYNEDITIYGDGLQTRTFCYIDDNIDATLKIFEEELYNNDVINIGNDVEVTIVDLAKMIISITDSHSKLVFVDPLKEGDMSRRQPDNSKMKSLLTRDLMPVEEGIKNILKLKFNFRNFNSDIVDRKIN